MTVDGERMGTISIAALVRQIIADKAAGVRCGHCGNPIPEPPVIVARRLCPVCDAAGHPIDPEPPF